MTKLALPDVTLVMVTTVAHELSRIAVEECVKYCDFGGILIVSDWPEKIVPPLDMLSENTRVITQIPHGIMDLEQACRYYWYIVPPLVQTSHFLVVQYDSWVVNPDAWTDDFLKYDYVGAPWWYADGKNVGNGGFSLRSTDLMCHLANNPDNFPFAMPEDDAICRRYRRDLEHDMGFTFAYPELAATFSYERAKPFDTDGHPIQPFGFHGAFNWPDVLSDEEIMARLRATPPELSRHIHYQQMFQELERRNRLQDRPPLAKSRIYAA